MAAISAQTRAISLLVFTTWVILHSCQGMVYMNVSPYPARVYENAPPGVAVLTVNAYDNSTGEAVSNFRLETLGLSEYFNITPSGLLQTAKFIDRKIGFQFIFFVFAVTTVPNNSVEYKHVVIEVSEKNLYPPSFTRDTYDMGVYRFAQTGTVIGSVSASDVDRDPYNKNFVIFAPPRQNQSVLEYVKVTSSGDVTLIKPLEDDVMVLPLLILAKDGGSPPLTATTTAVIIVDDVKQPDVFCLSTIPTMTILCWKNPMPGRTNPGYNVDGQGQGLVLHDHTDGDPNAVEYCVEASHLKLGENYTFDVTLDIADITQTTVGKVLAFTFLGLGYSAECLTEHFAACNFLRPCQNNAVCLMGNEWGLDYSCFCSMGWKGQNCTQEDLCASMPCQHGVCVFGGHRQYTCDCPPDYFGLQCQHFNVCAEASTSPCQNGGVCRMSDDDKSYKCACPDYFSGNNCSVPDPCSPSPCSAQGGTCVKVTDTEAKCDCNLGYHGPKCDLIDSCQLAQRCQNGATCVTTGNTTFTCTCRPTFTGTECETFNSCSMACENNATCILRDDGIYNCSCPPAYYGNECQHYDPCHTNPCANGTCNAGDQATAVCDCHPGFFGPRCEDYDACLTDPCHSHGNCSQVAQADRGEGGAAFQCSCSSSWWGPDCSFIDGCGLDFCHNGATCVNTPPNNFKCICPPGFFESDCSRFNPCAEVGHQRCSHGKCFNTTDNNFRCECDEGYMGDTCQWQEPCLSSPCLNGATCGNWEGQPSQSATYSCTCLPGTWGRHCQLNDSASCEKTPCSSGGTCLKDTAAGSQPRCVCAQGFLGVHCQISDPCFDGKGERGTGVCINGGTCQSVNRTDAESLTGDVNVDDLYLCHCIHGYTGRTCQVLPVDTSCDHVVCLNSGDCQSGVCTCPPGFTGSRCENGVSTAAPVTICMSSPCPGGFQCLVDGGSTFTCVCNSPSCQPACPAETPSPGESGRYEWPRTLAGQTAKRACPYGGSSDDDGDHFASRTCDNDPASQGSPLWGTVDDSQCNKMGLAEASRMLNELNALTSNPASLGPEKLAKYTAIIEDLYVFTLMDNDVASVMMNVISNLADVNVSVTVISSQQNDTSGRLVKVLEEYTADVNVTTGSNVSLVSPNFEVFAAGIDDKSAPFTFVPATKTDNTTTQLDVSITIPPEAFAGDSSKATSNRKLTRLQLIGHRKSQLFMPDNSGYSDDFILHQPVLSAVVAGRHVVNLSTPVVYTIRNLEPTANYTCVFWDPKNRTWSTEGVITTVKSGNSTECQSFHLTSFAVLLDPSPDFQLAAVHEKVLTYISYVGSAVSLFCLVLTVITYSLFRSLNKDKSGKILLNLCIALLLLNAVFLASGLTSSSEGDSDLDDDPLACRGVAVVLHYLLLAALAWMLVEAVEMYRALVTVFAKYATWYMLKRCLLGWGLPVVIVAVTLGVDTDNYGSDGAFCFLSRSNTVVYYGSLVAPACVVLLVNTVIFVMVTRVILKPRFQQQKQKEAEGVTPAQVRGAFTVMFLLGVTWVFGPLAINEAKLVFNYLFCILNSLQGFLIFVFRCLFNPEVRMCWLQLFKTGTLKKRRGPIRSNIYSDSSSKADGKSYHNGHGDAPNGSSTLKSSLMHTSNGWHPNLNGYPGSGGLERRGTHFSTVDFFRGQTPPLANDHHSNGVGGSSLKKKGGPPHHQHRTMSEHERYGDGGGDGKGKEGGMIGVGVGAVDEPSILNHHDLDLDRYGRDDGDLDPYQTRIDGQDLDPYRPGGQDMDFYETGHDGKGGGGGGVGGVINGGGAIPRRSVSYHDDYAGDGGVLDYYESIRPDRRQDSAVRGGGGGGGGDSRGSSPESQQKQQGEEYQRAERERSTSTSSGRSTRRVSSAVRNDQDGLTYL